MTEIPRLGEEYDGCLLGCTVGIHGPDVFVYSLKKLVEAEIIRTGNPAETVREQLALEITGIQRDHGALAPVFVNDEIRFGEAQDAGPKIITPGSDGFRKPPRRR